MTADAAVFVPDVGDLARGLRDGSAADAVLVAQQYLRLGLPRGALAVCEAARSLGLSEPSLALSEATARFALGDRAGALALTSSVLAADPLHPAALHLDAAMLHATGRVAESRARLVQLIDRFADYPGALGLLSSVLLPGRGYREVLARIHRALRPDTYLEIGVETGATLSLAVTATRAVGVDPAECPNEASLPASARLYRMESDAFFAFETRDTVLDGRAVDLAFIDGMHWFEHALRDFVNVERWCTEGSTIVLHDCLPVAPVAARRERETTFWVGDVWKVLEVLLEHRPDLRIRVVPTAPSGLVVVRGLDPSSAVLASRLPEIIESYREREAAQATGTWPSRYGVVPNDDSGLSEALGA